MDNNKKDPSSLVDGWLDEILERNNIQDVPEEITAEEIVADELAMDSVGLTHPDDLEFERIVQETIAANWGDDFGNTDEPAPENMEATQFFAPQQADEALIDKIGAKGSAFIKKLRPESKKEGLWGIPHILSTVIWLLIIVTIGVSLGRTLWVCAADLLALGKEGQEVTITIDEGEELPQVAEKLRKAGMIRYPALFEMFANLTGKGDNILTGSITFKEDTVYDYNALINAMSYKGGSLVTVEVMIPEGYSCAQIFALLEEKGVCSVSDLEEYAANGELGDFWFLQDVQRGHKYCLEGFLFPDTYEFYLNDDADRVIQKFLKDFDYRFTQRMVDKFVALNNSTGLNLSLREVVIMASIIEKEKANNLEGYTIASVYYNRLTHAGKYPFLNSDATILYATEYYNKGELITDEQINASPYNTYTQKGLPPTPIANPGLASLDAALEPENTSYYYYVLDKEANVHVFSRTLEEHNRKLKELGYTS